MDALPDGIRKNKEAMAETIENNVRKLIIDESPINPKYYEKMSELLDALIGQRKQEALSYQEYLAEDRRAHPASEKAHGRRRIPRRWTPRPGGRSTTTSAATRSWPSRWTTAVRDSMQDGWRGNRLKLAKCGWPSPAQLGGDEAEADGDPGAGEEPE